MRAFPSGTNIDTIDVVLRFRDAAGVMRRRRIDGTLSDLDAD
jgi:hypothetical protein